jgi:hypothetical protein
MYADDLILLTISVSDMQYLIDVCSKELQSIGMYLNINKSACLRIGIRHNVSSLPLTICDKELQWKTEMTYLGIKIAASKKFSVNTQNIKQKYFRALNSLFGKIGLSASPALLCSLIESFCVSSLLYAAESLQWNRSMMRSFENAYSQAFIKMFKSYDKNVIQQCQYYMGYLTIELNIAFRKLTFLTKLQASQNSICRHFVQCDTELKDLAEKYKIPPLTSTNCKALFKKCIWKCHREALGL